MIADTDEHGFLFSAIRDICVGIHARPPPLMTQEHARIRKRFIEVFRFFRVAATLPKNDRHAAPSQPLSASALHPQENGEQIV
jgi:hypothetical protein